MAFFLLNSPVLTDWGIYEFRGPIDAEQACHLLPNDFISAVGHISTAQVISQLLKRVVLQNRHQIVMKPGDQALVFRLLKRPPEGWVMNEGQLHQADYKFGVLHRLA